MALSTLLLNPTCVVLGTLLLLTVLWWRSCQRTSGLPPGPGPALPVLGHLYLLDKDPRTKFRQWRRQYGDVFSLYMGQQLVIVLNGYQAIKEALVKHADVFSHRPEMNAFSKMARNRGIVSTSGSHWKEQRKVSLEILREMGLGKNVMAARIQEEVNHYINALKSYKGRPVDVRRMTQVSISNNICFILFGQRFDYDDPTFTRCLQAMDENVQAIGGVALINFFPFLEYLPGDLFHMKRTIANAWLTRDILIKPQIQRRHEQPEGTATDFIHAYIREIRLMQESGQPTTLNDDNLMEVCLDLFSAGTETTSTCIRWALVFLLHHPHVQDKCHAEIMRVVGTERAPNMRDKPGMTYTSATILEVLRLANSVPLSLQHGVTHETTFRGYTIPKDAILLPVLETALLDPDFWEEPLQFRPERFIDPDQKLLNPEELIPFSTGKRVCLGESLARMELFLYLSAMIQHFCFLPPEDGQLPSLEGILGITHSPKPFTVRAVPRQVQ